MVKTITIDISQVPKEKLADPRFVDLHSQIERVLGNSFWLHAFSIHEAGHCIYFERAGVQEIRYFGPQIKYDPTKEEFIGFPASVQPQTASINPVNFALDRWFLDVAMAHAAGGVFARELTAAPDVGDDQDRENYENICNVLIESAIKNGTPISLDRNGLWTLAQETIQQELRSPVFRKEAWERAAEIRIKLFGRE